MEPGRIDLLPQDNRVLVAVPALLDPVGDAQQIEVTGPDVGRIVASDGFGNYREPVRLVRNEAGAVVKYSVAGTRLVPEGVVIAEMTTLYEPPSGRAPETQPER